MKQSLKHHADKIRDRLHRLSLKDFEIYIERKQGTKLEVRDGKRDVFELKSGLGFAIRMFKDDRVGFVYGSDFSDTAVDHVVQSSLQTLSFKNRDKHHSMVEPQTPQGQPQVLDPRFATIGVQDKLDFLCALESEACRAHSKIVGVKTAALDDEREEVYLENTLGVSCLMERTFYCASLGVQAEDGDDQEIAYDVRTETHFDRLDHRQIAEKAANQAVSLLGGRSMASFKGAVLFDASVMGTLIEIVASSFMGDNIERNNSRLKGKLGQQLYSPQITLVDDGLLDRASGSCPYDSEGTSVRQNVLIQSGYVHQFLYDQYWANRAGTTSTGNSIRHDVTSQPDLTYHNLVLRPGSKDPEAMLATMQTGIKVLDVIGLHNADEVSGDFSVGIQGVWFESARPVHAVRSMVLTANVHDLLSRVVEVGADYQFVGGVGTPSVLFHDIDISGN